MDKKQLIDRVACILVSSVNLKLKHDGLGYEDVNAQSNCEVFDDPTVFKRQRIGWFTYVAANYPNGIIHDIATAYDIRMKLMDTYGAMKQEDWQKLAVEVAHAATNALKDFLGGSTEYSEWTVDQIKAAVTEQELVD